MQIILASASPRRKELLEQIGWSPVVAPADFAELDSVGEVEEYLQGMTSDDILFPVKGQLEAFLGKPELVAVYNAAGKALSAAAVQKAGSGIVVGADTVVILPEEGCILGKPSSSEDAEHMLADLSGKVHEVITGMAVVCDAKTVCKTVKTKVYFRNLADREIKEYVNTGEPLDKAGAYGIQGRGAVLVEKIQGSYDNVVGLPLTALYKILYDLGVV